MYRLDVFLALKGYFSSRERAKDTIIAGCVFVDGKTAKPSQKVCGEEKIEIKDSLKYVSRAALKLEKAIKVFDIDLTGKVVLDIGSSTGGFTQISLLGGAKKVVAVDVGKDQMDKNLRKDKRIALFEETDFRFIESEKLKSVDFVVSDVSFISLKNIFPKILKEFSNKIEGIFLFKPQFECGKEIASKYKGVIKNKKVHFELLNDFVSYLKNLGFVVSKIDYSPIKGKSGNIEYLLYLNGAKSNFNIQKTIDEAFESL